MLRMTLIVCLFSANAFAQPSVIRAYPDSVDFVATDSVPLAGSTSCGVLEVAPNGDGSYTVSYRGMADGEPIDYAGVTSDGITFVPGVPPTRYGLELSLVAEYLQALNELNPGDGITVSMSSASSIAVSSAWPDCVSDGSLPITQGDLPEGVTVEISHRRSGTERLILPGGDTVLLQFADLPDDNGREIIIEVVDVVEHEFNGWIIKRKETVTIKVSGPTSEIEEILNRLDQAKRAIEESARQGIMRDMEFLRQLHQQLRDLLAEWFAGQGWFSHIFTR